MYMHTNPEADSGTPASIDVVIIHQLLLLRSSTTLYTVRSTTTFNYYYQGLSSILFNMEDRNVNYAG